MDFWFPKALKDETSHWNHTLSHWELQHTNCRPRIWRAHIQLQSNQDDCSSVGEQFNLVFFFWATICGFATSIIVLYFFIPLCLSWPYFGYPFGIQCCYAFPSFTSPLIWIWLAAHRGAVFMGSGGLGRCTYPDIHRFKVERHTSQDLTSSKLQKWPEVVRRSLTGVKNSCRRLAV